MIFLDRLSPRLSFILSWYLRKDSQDRRMDRPAILAENAVGEDQGNGVPDAQWQRA